MSVYRFEATLERPDKRGAWTFVRVPFNVAEEFRVKGQAPVKGTINDVPYENSLLPQGGGVHILVVKKEIRDRAGVDAGDVVQVALQRESGPRAVAVPPELADALQLHPGAQQIFDDLSYSHQKAYCNHVSQARKADTRIRRASRCVDLLLDSAAAGLTPGFRRSRS